MFKSFEANQRGLQYRVTTSHKNIMSKPTSPVVTETAYLTLHYRLASSEGKNIVSTFEENPATLQLGTGQLAPFLEACLIGLPEGAHQTFELMPEKAFGPRNPDLIQHVSRATLRHRAVVDSLASCAPLMPKARCLTSITLWRARR
jgi:hypothetical protein